MRERDVMDQEMVPDIPIIARLSDSHELCRRQALLIKENNPEIKVQARGFNLLFKILNE